MKVKG
jgi:hypothetical protein